QAAAALIVGAAPREIDARRQLAVKEIGFGEVQIELLPPRRQAEADTEILPAAEQVALADRDIAEHAFRRRVTDADGQFAGRLLGHLGGEDYLVRGAAAALGDLHLVEEIEAAQAGARATQLRGVEGIAFRKTEFAPHHLVQRADIADDVDTLDEYPRALPDRIGDIDDAVLAVALHFRPHIDECVAQPAEFRRDRLHRVLDLVSVVDVAGLGRNERL